MDIFNFCWLTLIEESKKNSIFFDKDTCNVRNDIDENFNKPVNRIAYLYKFGSFNISFFHQCFNEFLTKSPDSIKIIDDLRSQNNLTICSLSVGPGTDIIGLLYSLYVFNKPLINPTTFKVISMHGSWRNLVNGMMSSSIISVPESSTCKLLECDFLKELSKKAKGYLKAADIVLMCNSFSSSITPGKTICNTLERIHQLKLGALVFFIVNEEKSAYLQKLDSFGSFLYGPAEITLENMPYNEKIAELVGVKPVCSGRSLFAVWQKMYEVKSDVNLQNEKACSLTVDSNQHSPAKLIKSKSDTKNMKSQIKSLSNSKRESSSDTNISSSESIASSSWFSSSSISGENKKESIVSDNSLGISGHKIDFSETNFNFLKNISTTSVNTTDPLFIKKCAPQSEIEPKERNKNNMDSLLKNFESLITKLEGFIDSQDSLQNSHLKTRSSCGEPCHQGNHKCSVKACQFNRNSSMCCCHSTMCCDITNHFCSSSVTSNLYRILPQDGPCIVIPFQNLSNESLTKILSIVSQNCPSGNKT